MTLLTTRTYPWFALAAVVAVAGFVFVHGPAQGMVAAAAMFLFLGACIRGISLSVRDNPVSAKMLASRDLVHSALVSESSSSAQRRRGAR
jgi:hypothetical protein